jgi:NIMA (never in mitosis gene a)-related kinase
MHKAEQELAARAANVAKAEAELQAKKAEVDRREAECAAREASAQETQSRLNAAAEQLRLQWDKFREERDAAGAAQAVESQQRELGRHW